MTTAVQSTLNALVLQLSHATPGEEHEIEVLGNAHTKSYAYSVMKVMGIQVISLKENIFNIIIPENHAFPVKEKVVQFMGFISAYAEDIGELTPLVLRQKALALTVALRDANEDQIKQWEEETPHEWQDLDKDKAKAIKIKEDEANAADKSKLKPGISPGMKVFWIVFIIAASIAAAIFAMSNNGIGGARGGFYTGNFIIQILKGPAIMLDMTAFYLSKIVVIGMWMPYVLAISIFVFALKRMLTKKKKAERTFKQKLAAFVANIPYIAFKLWLWTNYIFFCYVLVG